MVIYWLWVSKNPDTFFYPEMIAEFMDGYFSTTLKS